MYFVDRWELRFYFKPLVMLELEANIVWGLVVQYLPHVDDTIALPPPLE